LAPQRVKHRDPLTIEVGLHTRATVTISLLLGDRTVNSFDEGSQTGKFTQDAQAPSKKAQYVIRVHAVAGDVKQTVEEPLTVL
jgi:hypothetical protein